MAAFNLSHETPRNFIQEFALSKPANVRLSGVAPLCCDYGCFHARSNLEFEQYAGHMLACRTLGNSQPFRDAAIRQASDHKFEYFRFAPGERARSQLPPAGDRLWPGGPYRRDTRRGVVDPG
jgi:hypothetical protein